MLQAPVDGLTTYMCHVFGKLCVSSEAAPLWMATLLSANADTVVSSWCGFLQCALSATLHFQQMHCM
jgi:hypothetical protein